MYSEDTMKGWIYHWGRKQLTGGRFCLGLRNKTETPEWQGQHGSRKSNWEAEREYRKQRQKAGCRVRLYRHPSILSPVTHFLQ